MSALIKWDRPCVKMCLFIIWSVFIVLQRYFNLCEIRVISNFDVPGMVLTPLSYTYLWYCIYFYVNYLLYFTKSSLYMYIVRDFAFYPKVGRGFLSLCYFSHIMTWKQDIEFIWNHNGNTRDSNSASLVLQAEHLHVTPLPLIKSINYVWLKNLKNVRNCCLFFWLHIRLYDTVAYLQCYVGTQLQFVMLHFLNKVHGNTVVYHDVMMWDYTSHLS